MTKNHKTITQIPDSLESTLYKRLLERGVYKEYELMQQLVEEGFSQFKPSLDPLELFRAHFLLFHILYRLQDKWQTENKGQLFIHALEIRLVMIANTSSDTPCLADFGHADDNIKTYYLDYSAFLETQEQDVLELIDSFWQSFAKTPFIKNSASHLTLERAMEILEVTPPLCEKQINRQFRKLSQNHHPDKGGEAETFRQLCDAREVLKSRC